MNKEPRFLLLYNDHYYRLFPKNKFTNLTKYVVRLKSPFEESLNNKEHEEETTIANSEGPDPAAKSPAPGSEPVHLTTSQPIKLLTDGPTKSHKGTNTAGIPEAHSDSKVTPSEQTQKAADTGTPFGVLGSALVGFLAGAGLVTTVYGLFKGGEFLYKKLFSKESPTEPRRHKRRDFTLQE
jgi:hypothetical protein